MVEMRQVLVETLYTALTITITLTRTAREIDRKEDRRTLLRVVGTMLAILSKLRQVV